MANYEWQKIASPILNVKKNHQQAHYEKLLKKFFV
jgi:hypothetical protein